MDIMATVRCVNCATVISTQPVEPGERVIINFHACSDPQLLLEVECTREGEVIQTTPTELGETEAIERHDCMADMTGGFWDWIREHTRYSTHQVAFELSAEQFRKILAEFDEFMRNAIIK